MTEKNEYVPWRVFVWVIAISTSLMGYLFYSVGINNQRLDQIVIERTKIQVQLSQIQTDLLWIKEKLSTK